jgi:hypothetical protein
MITSTVSQFKALLSKELKEAFRDKRAMLSDISAMMIRSATCLIFCSVTGASA